MKIALTSLYLPSGSKIGVGYVVHYFANQLTQRGHDVTVFSQCEASDGSLYKTVTIPPRSRGATFGFAWDLRNVDFKEFDAVNAHGDDWFLWGKTLPRHVHTFHGSCLAEMIHSRSLLGKLRMGALAACETNVALWARTRVSVSENNRRYIPRIQHVIPNGVDIEQFAPVDENQKSKEPTILMVGSLYGRKRGDMLVKAFREVVKPQIPNARLWCVSEAPTEGAQDGEEFFGRVPLEKLLELYPRAWVFCLPSSYEGFGVPYIEAMAAGTPVVATPNDGSREVLRNGQDGLLCEDEQLGETLVRLLQDEQLRRELREKGLQRTQDFSWDRVCGEYLKLYGLVR